MVRNGEETLEATIYSVVGQTDRILACMAGESTDGTEELLQTHNAVITHRPWKDNFAAARNHLFDFARMQGAEWVLLLDADDVLVCDSLRTVIQRLDECHCTSALVSIRFGSLRYMQKRLFNLSAPGAWVGRVHEVYVSDGATLQCPEVQIVHTRATKVSNPERNLRIFSKWHEEAPDEFDGHIYYNYANELMWHHKYAEAARMYELSVAESVWDDEEYFALIRRGNCLVNTKEWTDAWPCFIEAVKLKPNWKDAYLAMSRWFYYQELWELSFMLSLQADRHEPADTIMPVNSKDYTIGQMVYDSYALGKLGQTAQALSVTKRGLEIAPTNQMLLQNLEVYKRRSL